MADDQTIARIDAYILANNGDLTIRSGGLSADEPDVVRVFTGELATAEFDWLIGENGEGVATLGEALDYLDSQIGRIGGD